MVVGIDVNPDHFLSLARLSSQILPQTLEVMNVMWIRMAVPAIEPIFRDEDMACLAMVGLRGQLKDDVVLFRGSAALG